MPRRPLHLALSRVLDAFDAGLLGRRWADREVLSRDLIDLAALRRWRGPVPSQAWTAAEAAYRSAPRDDLAKAVAAFLADPAHQKRCFEGLAVEAPAPILEGIEELESDLVRG